jgi:hypothetical protein
MKNLVLLIALLSLSACNKGIKKSQGLAGLLPHQGQTSAVNNKNIELNFETEYHLAMGYACNVKLPKNTLPIFIEPIDIKGETKYKFHLAVNKSAQQAILSQFDFDNSIDAAKDAPLLAGLGFSRHQIKKIETEEADKVEVSSEVFFDETELTGYMERKSLAKNSEGKIIKSTTQFVGDLSDCVESELEVEI